ncbi:DC1 [Dillenia turbinata]|uniref:DC1 n=1 Tax=Dillenia turbinata TaxID=194707 RepID=A0AAN8VL65_9MAGN
MAPLNKVQAPPLPPSSQHLNHPMHPDHPLQQIYSSKEFECDGCNSLGSGTRYSCDTCCFDLLTMCFVCRYTCTSWRYRCGTCGVDIHLESAFFVPPEAATKSTLVTPSPPPLGQPQTLGVPLPLPYPYGYPINVTHVYNYNPGTSNVAVPSKRRKRDVIFKIVGIVGRSAVDATVQAAALDSQALIGLSPYIWLKKIKKLELSKEDTYPPKVK